MNLRLALIGQSIGHSKSECIYRELLAGSGVNLSYQMLDCATSVDIPSLAELGDRFDGVSITSPYKRFFFDKVIERFSKKKIIMNNKIEEAITDKTKCIFIPHTVGIPANLDIITQIANKYNLFLLENYLQYFAQLNHML